MSVPAQSRESNGSAGPRWWVARALLEHAAPAWLILCGGGLLLALVWRALPGGAPAPLQLCTGLSAVYWLVALWLAEGWAQLRRGAPPVDSGASVIVRGIPVVVSSVIAVALACAPLGLLAAFDNTISIYSFSPLDLGQVSLTLPGFLLRICLQAGPAFILLSLGLLLLLRHICGERHGTALWLVLGIVLHSPQLLGPELSSCGLCLAAFSQQVVLQLTNIDLHQSDQVFDPLRFRLGLSWAGALALLAVSGGLGLRQRSLLQPMPLALSGALLSTALHSHAAANAWVRHPSLQHSAPPADLAAHFVVSGALLWCVFAAQRPSHASPRRPQPWLLLLPATALFYVLGLPALASRAAGREALVLVSCLAGVCLLLILAGGRVLQTLPVPRTDAPWRRMLAAVLPSLFCIATLGVLFGRPDSASPSALGTLATALLNAEQLPTAALVLGGAVLATGGLLWLGTPRTVTRARQSRRPATIAPPSA